MSILVFRTDIKTRKKVKSIRPLLNAEQGIIEWFIDIEDIDNVMRLKVNDQINEDEVIKLVRTNGFYCETLTC